MVVFSKRVLRFLSAYLISFDVYCDQCRYQSNVAKQTTFKTQIAQSMKTLFLCSVKFLILIFFCQAQILINCISKLRIHKLHFAILRMYQSLYKYPAFELISTLCTACSKPTNRNLFDDIHGRSPNARWTFRSGNTQTCIHLISFIRDFMFSLRNVATKLCGAIAYSITSPYCCSLPVLCANNTKQIGQFVYSVWISAYPLRCGF